jgi:dienelactone hydrolase
MTDVTIQGRQGRQGSRPTYLASPPEGGPWRDVIVLHDALGMRGDLRNQADWLASEGHLRWQETCSPGAVRCGACRTC